MAKMIKHKDSYISNSLYQSMLKKVQRVVSASESTTLVYMDNQQGTPIEVKAQFPIKEIADNIEEGEYSGEISEFLFSYYIGEV